ncbi:MAG: hypothetical protein RBS19_01225 [Bacteroidales bacterium]|nr:hypothetical protein [Bacteroidales bacterium]
MKKIFTFILFLFTTFTIYSQDIITKQNGDEIKAKVMEITSAEIKYKRFENLDGPVYSMDLKEVFMIKYENGDKDVFTDKNILSNQNYEIRNDFIIMKSGKAYQGDNLLTKREFSDLMATNPNANNLYQYGKTLGVIGYIFAFPSGFVFGFTLGSSLFSWSSTKGVLLGVSGLGIMGGLIFASIGDSKITQAISIYNSSNQVGLKVQLKFNENGIGVALKF